MENNNDELFENYSNFEGMDSKGSILGLRGKTLISFWQKSKLFENNFDGFRRVAKVSTSAKSLDGRQKFRQMAVIVIANSGQY